MSSRRSWYCAYRWWRVITTPKPSWRPLHVGLFLVLFLGRKISLYILKAMMREKSLLANVRVVYFDLPISGVGAKCGDYLSLASKAMVSTAQKTRLLCGSVTALRWRWSTQYRELSLFLGINCTEDAQSISEKLATLAPCIFSIFHTRVPSVWVQGNMVPSVWLTHPQS